jgi:signal transduction histidine kinase
MIPLYGISSLLIGITSVAISTLVFVKGQRNKTNKIWFILTLSIATYGFGAYMVSLAKDAESAFSWWQVAYLGVVTIPVLFMHFVNSYLDIKRPFFMKFLYVITLILLILNIFRRDLFLGDVTLFFADSQVFKPGYWVYPSTFLLKFFILFVFGGVAILSHLDLIKGYRRESGFKRQQIKYFFIGTASGFIGGGTSFLPCFNISLYPVFNIAVVIYPIITSYAILKYRLMDVRVTFTRTGIFVGIYTLVLGLPFILAIYAKTWLIRILGSNWWFGPLFSGTVLATAGPFAYIYFQKKAEAVLLREQRNYQEILRQTAMGITRIRNPKELLESIVNILTDTVYISHSAIYLFDQNSEQFVLKAGRNLKVEHRALIDAKSPLIVWLQKNKTPLIYEEVKQKSRDNPEDIFKGIEEEILSLDAAVVIPSFLENKLLNLIILGDKLLGRIYTSEDLNIFSVLASQAALAIENASLYENIEEQVKQRTKELVEVQKQLTQAEKLATVGTLAGGVAHEINNPLTAILTNVQMLLSSGELDKESLEMIEEATKRCKTIVQKLMAYSKKPMESTMVYKINLLEVTTNAVNFLKFQLEQDNMKIKINASQDNFLIKANHNEIEQVITNIVLNARDAIKQIKKSGIIEITLSQTDETVKIEIRDEGIGIPKEVMPRIFDPFFTTKEVGKGLGLGLSICQSIVDKHNGKIIVNSEVNKGSTFVVTLPRLKEKIMVNSEA